MRPRLSSLLCLLLLTLSSCSAAAEVGWDNPLAVFVTYPAGDHGVGSSVTVTVHVFKEGARFDPDTVTLNVGAEGRDVPLTKQSVGTYTGTFTVADADIEWDSLGMYATVEDGFIIKDMAVGYAYIYFWGTNLFSIDFGDTGDRRTWYAPGETIDVRALFTYDGSPVDPDPGTLEATLYDSDWDELPFELTRVSTGVYEGSFAVPAGLRDSEMYEVEVSAEYSPEGVPLHSSVSMDFPVDFMQLWVHFVDVALGKTQFDMYVLDLANATVEGATVVVNYTYYDDTWEEVTKQRTSTTGEDGKVSMTLDHSDVDPEDAYVDLEGYVESGGFRQRFDYYLQLAPDGGGVDPDEPFAVVLLDEEPLPPSTAVDLHLRAYTYGNPLPATDVISYVTSEHAVHYNGVIRTDAAGRFTVPVTTPPVGEDEWGSFVDCEWQTQLMTEWVSTSEWFMVAEEGSMNEFETLMDPLATVTVESLRLGGVAEVTVDHPDADGADEEAVVMWTIGDPTAWSEDLLYPEWTTLNEGDMGWWGFMGSAMAEWSGGAFHASFVLPEFLPEDIKVFVMGLILFGDPDVGDIHGAYVKDLSPLPANPPPVALITVPAAGEQYSGILTATGTATDDVLVDGVEARIDGGEWTAVTGTDAWTFTINTTGLTSGTHMLEARAYDGDKHSPVVSVVFEVDQPPTVVITTPDSGRRVNATFLVGGTAADDNAVDRVEYRVDSGTWDPATGTTAWTAEVSVGGLTSGVHTVEVRSSDGERTSVVTTLAFVVDHRPSVTISAPANASTLKKAFDLLGTTHDDIGVAKVEGRLDGGAWTELAGTTAWSWTVGVKGLAEGEHTLEVRSWDGYSYSDVASIAFTYKEPEESPGPTAALALLALAGAGGVAHLATRGWRR